MSILFKPKFRLFLGSAAILSVGFGSAYLYTQSNTQQQISLASVPTSSIITKNLQAENPVTQSNLTSSSGLISASTPYQ
ncbi:hypothetical protein CI594_02305, partial [Fischerella thermalis CCMEE 5196]